MSGKIDCWIVWQYQRANRFLCECAAIVVHCIPRPSWPDLLTANGELDTNPGGASSTIEEVFI
ncbi:hypothetical protein J6590_019387 [Homalodisca vitripennis]|nr:hypothetical protein J6590_019387 [Homalodisca vitripennis]